MTVETQIDPSRETATSNRTLLARRHGERSEMFQRSKKDDDELIFPSLSPPSWPRVFPGL